MKNIIELLYYGQINEAERPTILTYISKSLIKKIRHTTFYTNPCQTSKKNCLISGKNSMLTV